MCFHFAVLVDGQVYILVAVDVDVRPSHVDSRGITHGDIGVVWLKQCSKVHAIIVVNVVVIAVYADVTARRKIDGRTFERCNSVYAL